MGKCEALNRLNRIAFVLIKRKACPSFSVERVFIEWCNEMIYIDNSIIFLDATASDGWNGCCGK
jgi:hypothetical protein